MTPCFHPRLVNSPFDDPGLYINFLYQSRALLFDVGDITALTAREIHKITDVFVSHTHVDHFIGLDHIIRLFLGREKHLNIYGPPGIIENVAGKLSAYTWNLVDNYENRFEIQVWETHPEEVRRAVFRCHNLFQKEMAPDPIPFTGELLNEEDFLVKAILLDHYTPCLAFSMEEKYHINIKKDRLVALNLPSGPWLRELKQTIRQEKPDDYSLIIEGKRNEEGPSQEKTIGWMRDENLFSISHGQKIVYIVDIGYTSENISRVISFAEKADHLFCEAAFLEKERQIAEKKYHLTAYQAGLIARNAKVRRLTPFHFSPRYQESAHLLYQEAECAFTAS